MDFLILGPLDVRTASGSVSLGPKPKAVLAVLLLHANEPVSAERLALAVWGEEVPGGAVANVHQNVSRLRKALGDPDAVSTTAAGYCLRVRPGELDAERFEGLVEDARRALDDGQPESAADILREALGLWRGPALAEFAYEPFARSEADRLEEQRLAALELRVEADLLAGRHAELVGELTQLVADHPAREGLAGQLMLALYRCGRQSDAIAAYTVVQRTLDAELGVVPGPRLRELHAAIVNQDASLQLRAGTPELPAVLDATMQPPLVGRQDELAWLLARWQRACEGVGALVTLTGPRGIGKQRLLMELATKVHGPSVAVVHVAGKRSADAVVATLREVIDAKRPTLVVVEDADSADRLVQSELARIGPMLVEVPVLVIACATEALALAHLRADENLELGALDVAGVRQIAARYAPAGTAEVPADWLLKASGGVPSRVHESANKWAQREAARRVDETAERAQAGRAELRALEAELTGGVVVLQEARDRELPGGGGGRPPIVCPYMGLEPYEAVAARFFKGRSGLIGELVARLIGSPLLGIVGPSGSGKSSVLRAGLLPELAKGVMQGEICPQVLFRPGSHPLQKLATELAAVEQSGRIVLAIDQFEETFTVCEDESERAEFIHEIVTAAQDPDRRWVIVLALRADHYGRCADYPELASLLAASNVLVRPMQPDELREAITQPARLAGLSIDDELVDALVADVERQPGALPLMSTTLLQLWERREGRRLSHVSYARLGGIQGAVARLAEDAFGQLDADEQQLARSVFMRLVGSTDGDVVERRRVTLDELEVDRDENVARVVALLADRRLLTISARSVELAHEALLREWPRLRGWIDEDRDGLRIQRGLSLAAAEWERLGRDEGALFRGTRLSEAAEWREARQPVLTALEREFLTAGELGREHERVTRRRRTALLVGSAGAVILAVVVVAIITVLTNRERDIVASRDIAAKSASLVDADPELALTLAREALDRRDTPPARIALRQATFANRVIAAVPDDIGALTEVAVSSRGKLVATAGGDGPVRIRDIDSRRVVATLMPPGRGVSAEAISLSRDGKRIAIGYSSGEIVTANTDASGRRRLLKLAGDDYAISLDFDADGSSIAVGTNGGDIRLVGSGQGGGNVRFGTAEQPVYSVSFDRSGTRFASASGDSSLVWNTATRTSTMLGAPREATAASFSADGRVVTAHASGHVRIWDAATGGLARGFQVTKLQVLGVAFSADGREIVTAEADGAVRVLDAGTGELLSDMRASSGNVNDVAFVPGRRTILSVAEDGVLRVWGPPAVVVVDRPAGAVSFSSDGHRVVTSGAAGEWLWDLGTGRQTRIAQVEFGGVTTFSADGDQIAISSYGGLVRVYDVAARKARQIPGSPGQYAAAVDRSGGSIAFGGREQKVVLARPDGTVARELRGHTNDIFALAFSPDGRRLVSASRDKTARIWNVKTGASERILRGHDLPVEWVAYSDDGKHVATAGDDGTVRVWPVGGGTTIVLEGHRGRVNTVEFGPRGDLVVSAGNDGTVRVWDARGGRQLVVLRTTEGRAVGADFSPDGRRIVSATADGMAVTQCDACGAFEQVLRAAERRPQRKLTAAERERLLQ